MTASAMAAINSGPPSADATIQRIDEPGRCGEVACAVVRAVPHTISSTGSSGSTRQLMAGDRDRHLMNGQPHAGDGAQGAGHVAVGDDELQQRHRRDDDERNQGRAERNPNQVTRLARADCPLLLHPCHSSRWLFEMREERLRTGSGPTAATMTAPANADRAARAPAAADQIRPRAAD